MRTRTKDEGEDEDEGKDEDEIEALMNRVFWSAMRYAYTLRTFSKRTWRSHNVKPFMRRLLQSTLLPSRVSRRKKIESVKRSRICDFQERAFDAGLRLRPRRPRLHPCPPHRSTSGGAHCRFARRVVVTTRPGHRWRSTHDERWASSAIKDVFAFKKQRTSPRGLRGRLAAARRIQHGKIQSEAGSRT